MDNIEGQKFSKRYMRQNSQRDTRNMSQRGQETEVTKKYTRDRNHKEVHETKVTKDRSHKAGLRTFPTALLLHLRPSAVVMSSSNFSSLA